MRETDGDDPVVTLSDDVVTLRPWSRDDAGFIADASADPAIRRYSVPQAPNVRAPIARTERHQPSAARRGLSARTRSWRATHRTPVRARTFVSFGVLH